MTWLLWHCRNRDDPYERNWDHFHHPQLVNSNEQSDNLSHELETMYGDDEIVGTAQTTPWFNPEYLTSDRHNVSIMHAGYHYLVFQLINHSKVPY